MSEFDFVVGTKVAEFIASNRPVDYLQGPLGPTSGDTEFLTPTGWKQIKDFAAGDLVGEWDNGILVFRAPSEFIVQSCNEMWWFHNRYSLSMMVSGEHRCPVYDWAGKFAVRSADELAAHPSIYRVPISFRTLTPDIPFSDADIRLAIAVKADGCLPKQGRQCVVTVRKQRKKVRMRELLGASAIEFTERQHSTRDTELTFAFARAGFDKHFGDGWWCASERQLEIILNECLLWDGLANHSECRYFTIAKGDADFIQYAAHALGRRATISCKIDRRKASWAPIYTVQITAAGSRKTSVYIRKDSTKIERVPAPDGKKYCFVTASGFFVARHNNRIFVTGNSGKTKACCIRLMRHAQEQKRSPLDGLRHTRFALVRDTLPNLKRSTVRTWLETFPQEVYGKFNASPGFMQHKISFDDVRTEFDFMSLDKADDVKKLRSTEYTGIFFNELPFMNKEIFDEADSRLRFPPEIHGGPTWTGIIADGNAPDEDCWLAMMTGQVDLPPGLSWDEKQQYHWPAHWGFYMQPPALLEQFDDRGQLTGYGVNAKAENLKNLKADYYAAMIPGKSRAWIDSRLMNRVALAVEGEPVWPMFRREFHVARAPLLPIADHDVMVALDFGRVFPAALFAQDINERIYVQYEMLGFNEPASMFAPKVKRFLEQHYPGHAFRVVGDPKGKDRGQQTEQSSYDIFKFNGMPVTPAPVKQNNIAERTEAVAYILNDNPRGENRLVISPACRTLIVGMAGRYHLVREEDGELRPKKDKYSNLCDSLQYLCLSLGEGRRMIGLKPVVDLRPVMMRPARRVMRRIQA